MSGASRKPRLSSAERGRSINRLDHGVWTVGTTLSSLCRRPHALLASRHPKVSGVFRHRGKPLFPEVMAELFNTDSVDAYVEGDKSQNSLAEHRRGEGFVRSGSRIIQRFRKRDGWVSGKVVSGLAWPGRYSHREKRKHIP